MKSIKTNFCFIYSFLLRHRLLVEAGRLSLLNYFIFILKEPEYLLEVRLLQAEYMVKSLGENEQLYSKSSVEVKWIFVFTC
jgi:hypothetical protein